MVDELPQSAKVEVDDAIALPVGVDSSAILKRDLGKVNTLNADGNALSVTQFTCLFCVQVCDLLNLNPQVAAVAYELLINFYRAQCPDSLHRDVS